MYAGTTFRIKSGRVMGVHQKIDRVARRHLAEHIPRNLHFPSARDIVHFEGLQGPDGVKRKSPANDVPWHFIDPADPNDRAVMEMINGHMHNLSAALMAKNNERAAFEASWMAHAITDGLTPAHHFPLNAKIEELFGMPAEERVTVRDKNIIKGNGKRDTIVKNWEYWGARGVWTSHFMFEWGVATAIKPLKFEEIDITETDITSLKDVGFERLFLDALHTIADMNMYDRFCRQGWTHSLAKETREILIPLIIKMVCLAWLKAVIDIDLKKPEKTI